MNAYGILFFLLIWLIIAVVLYFVFDYISSQNKKKALELNKTAEINNSLVLKQEAIKNAKTNMQIALLANVLAELRNKKPDVYNTHVTKNTQVNYVTNTTNHKLETNYITRNTTNVYDNHIENNEFKVVQVKRK